MLKLSSGKQMMASECGGASSLCLLQNVSYSLNWKVNELIIEFPKYVEYKFFYRFLLDEMMSPPCHTDNTGK